MLLWAPLSGIPLLPSPALFLLARMSWRLGQVAMALPSGGGRDWWHRHSQQQHGLTESSSCHSHPRKGCFLSHHWSPDPTRWFSPYSSGGSQGKAQSPGGVYFPPQGARLGLCASGPFPVLPPPCLVGRRADSCVGISRLGLVNGRRN